MYFKISNKQKDAKNYCKSEAKLHQAVQKGCKP